VRVVDTHAHIYSTDTAKYPRREKPLVPPEGTGTVEHMIRETRANGVSNVVLIQTLTHYHFDNRATCDIATDQRGWTTAVVTLDPLDASSPSKLAELVAKRNVRGLRTYPTEDNHRIFDHPGHRALWQAADELGLTICVLIGMEHTDQLAGHLLRHPNVPVVLDHCMDLHAGDTDKLARVLELAALPNLHAKVTFAVTGSKEAYPCADTHDLVHAVIEGYGPRRCMWGSDFPCELWCPKVTYAQHLAIFQKVMRLEPATLSHVLGETADRLWFASR